MEARTRLGVNWGVEEQPINIVRGLDREKEDFEEQLVLDTHRILCKKISHFPEIFKSLKISTALRYI